MSISMRDILQKAREGYLRSVKHLTFSSCNFDNKHMGILATALNDMPVVETLNLENNTFDHIGLGNLCKSGLWKVPLIYLNLSDNNFGIHPLGCYELSTFLKKSQTKHIRFLYLSGCQIDDFGLNMISSFFSERHAEKLEELRLSNNNLGTNELSDEHGIPQLLKAMPSLPNLTSLSLDSNLVRVKDLIGISNTAQSMMQLRKLFLCKSKIRDEGLIQFSEALILNALSQSPVTLNLVEIDLGENQFTARGFAYFCGALAAGVFPKLERLHLNGNNIEEGGIVVFTETIAPSTVSDQWVLPNLQHLSMHNMQIGDAGLFHIAEVLVKKSLPVLKSIRLDRITVDMSKACRHRKIVILTDGTVCEHQPDILGKLRDRK